MNDRIEQLAEQCWVHTNEPLFGAKSPHWEFDRQKFAELIVKECAERLLNDVKLTDIRTSRCVASINEHFGIEE